MKWNKKGHIFKANGQYDWMKEYAQVPTPVISDNIVRIYFTTRPEPINGLYKSETGYIEVEKKNPQNILNISKLPVIKQGKLGAFDEFGIMPGSFTYIDNKLAMYYTGWSREQSVPYTTSIGLAISYDDGKTFKRISEGPIISKSINDPYLVNGPYVLNIESEYHMWYSSANKWLKTKEKKDPIYKIKHAISKDGINWLTNDNFIIQENILHEAQNAPCVFTVKNKYYMIFCYRKSIDFRNNFNGYKLGLAISEDLKKWIRIKDPELIGLELEWDMYMKAYPRILKVDDNYLLFYNGNYFGKDGFGYAELEL
jgi:predicted GH43/DUF377 family glycosyl hydrolase